MISLNQTENTIKTLKTLPTLSRHQIQSTWSKLPDEGWRLKLLSPADLTPSLYVEIWRDYRDMNLSSNGILNFQEQMVYYFPGKIIAPSGFTEVPKPCIITIWKDRRNITNYKQADLTDPNHPRRVIRRFERVQLLKLSLDIRNLIMNAPRDKSDTIH